MRRHLLTAALVFATIPLLADLRPGKGSAVAQEADSALEQVEERTPGATLPGEPDPETGFEPTPVDPSEVDDDLRGGSPTPDARGTVGESTAPFPTTGDPRIFESPDQDGVGGAGTIEGGPDPVIEPGVVDTPPGQPEIPAAADAQGVADEAGVTDPQDSPGGSGIYEGTTGAETGGEEGGDVGAIGGAGTGGAEEEGGAAETGAAETGAAETGAAETGAAETGAAETGAAETGAAETGAAETGAAETGAAETGAPETGGEQTEAPETGGFGGTEPAAPRASGSAQAAGAEQQQMLEALRAQQQAIIEQQQAFEERQAEITDRTAELEQLELDRAAEVEAARLARVQRIDNYGEVAELLIQSDTALIGGELDVGELLDVATEQLESAESLALSQGRGVEAQLASGALAEILRASEALGRRDVYAARLALQESGVLLGEARLVARQQQLAPQ